MVVALVAEAIVTGVVTWRLEGAAVVPVVGAIVGVDVIWRLADTEVSLEVVEIATLDAI